MLHIFCNIYSMLKFMNLVDFYVDNLKDFWILQLFKFFFYLKNNLWKKMTLLFKFCFFESIYKIGAWATKICKKK